MIAVLILGAGAVAAVILLGARGGADSPGAAVALLASDMSSEKYLDAYSRLHPAEVQAAAGLGQVVTDELTRLEVFRPDADLSASFGSTKVEGLTFDEAAAEPVRDNVVITKLVAGTITISSDPVALPFTDAFRDAAFPDGLPAAEKPMTFDVADLVRQQGEPIRVATVRVEGKWYVSLLYTAADYALRAAGDPWPTTTVEARGAANPEAALRETVQAALDLDVRRLIELAPPQELPVLHDVGDALIRPSPTAGGTGAKVVELETRASPVDGGTGLSIARVVVEDRDGDRLAITRAGECLTIEALGGTRSAAPRRICGAQDLLGQAGVDMGSSVSATLAPKLLQAALDVTIVTVENGGSHYVSPVRTVTNLYGDILEVLEPEDLRELIRAGR